MGTISTTIEDEHHFTLPKLGEAVIHSVSSMGGKMKQFFPGVETGEFCVAPLKKIWVDQKQPRYDDLFTPVLFQYLFHFSHISFMNPDLPKGIRLQHWATFFEKKKKQIRTSQTKITWNLENLPPRQKKKGMDGVSFLTADKAGIFRLARCFSGVVC